MIDGRIDEPSRGRARSVLTPTDPATNPARVSIEPLGPLLSVIVKAFNEEGKIAGCLASVLEATRGYRTQIIVADSRSEDRTVEIAAGFGVNVVRLAPSEARSCGVGGQLGFQYSAGEYVLLVDADMRFAPAFLPQALAALTEDHGLAAVGGIMELDEANLDYRLRRERNMQHLRPGMVDRLDGGGLYRRAAIAALGYFTNRNLHSYEEFELAVRLRAAGWQLKRLAVTSLHHFGHREPALLLLLRRWRSRYTDGQGETVRALIASGLATRAIREFWLSLVVIGWWGCVLAAFLSAFAFSAGGWLLLGLLLLPFSIMTAKRRSLVKGCYSVVLWQVTAAGFIRGMLRQQSDPRAPIASEVVHRAAEFPVRALQQVVGVDAGSAATTAMRPVISRTVAS